MRRRRRFPLASTILALIIAAGVAYVSFIDVDVPRIALAKIGDTVVSLASSLQLLGRSEAEGGLTFSVGSGLSSAGSSGGQADQAAPVPMLVNKDNPVPDDYRPDNMVRLREYCDKSVVTVKGSEIDGDRVAVDALMVMFRAAIADGVTDWQINAGYRSVSYQQTVWNNKAAEYRKQGLSASQAQTATAKYVAKPGCSEHHTGLAFDVTVPGQSFPLTEQCKWLAAHCWEYGFVVRYTEDKEAITGINAEQWHIRYVGQPHAQIMHEKNWCLEEYIAALNP